MNGLSRRPLRGLAAALALGTALPAFAQDMPDVVEEDKVKAQLEETAKLAAEKPLEGWQYKLDVGFNAGYNHSSTVVGQPDGATLQLGIAVNGAADLYAGQHEWHNSLTIAHQQTKTPAIDPFVKTSDNFELMTMWLYKPVVLPWLGPFARARLQTQIFAGHLVFGEDKNLAIRDVDGNVVLPGDLTTITVDQADGTTKQFSQLPAQEEYKLTDPFEPLTLRQSVGAFARALDRNDVKVTFTLGLGAQEVLTQEGYTLADDDKTNELEIKQLQDSQQVGVEVGAEASGTIGQQITWSVNANTLYPFIVEADTDLEGVDLTNVEFNGKVGVKLAKWASLDYVLTAKRIPLVLDDWQVQNGVLLSTAFNLLLKRALRELARRGWPYVIGVGVSLFFALAENQSRTGQALGGNLDFGRWLSLHATLPVDYALVEPSGWWAVGIIAPLALLHACWPRWWWAPFAFGGMAAWTFWGSVLIGRMA